MPYVNSEGRVLDRRSPWRLSIISDCFWAVVDFFWFFINTMINPDSAKRSSRQNRQASRRKRGDDGGDGGGGGRPSGTLLSTSRLSTLCLYRRWSKGENPWYARPSVFTYERCCCRRMRYSQFCENTSYANRSMIRVMYFVDRKANLGRPHTSSL